MQRQGLCSGPTPDDAVYYLVSSHHMHGSYLRPDSPGLCISGCLGLNRAMCHTLQFVTQNALSTLQSVTSHLTDGVSSHKRKKINLD